MHRKQNMYILLPFSLIFFGLNQAIWVKIPRFKNYWNYCGSEKTTADTICMIAIYLSIK